MQSYHLTDEFTDIPAEHALLAIDSQKKIREAEGRVEGTGQCLRDTAFLADHHLHMVLRRRYPSCSLPYT